MCIRRETREKARQSLAFSPVSKPHTHITYICFDSAHVLYIYGAEYNNIEQGEAEFNIVVLCSIKPDIDQVQV